MNIESESERTDKESGLGVDHRRRWASNPAHRIGIRWLIAMSTTMAIAVATSAYVAFEVALRARPSFPSAAAAEVELHGRNRVDVLLVDDPAPEVAQSVRDIVLPMLAVMRYRLAGQPVHLRIIIAREGFPGAWKSQGRGIAGYQPDDDSFVIDAGRVLNSNVTRAGGRLALEQHLAFLMAHEATHLYQARRGLMKPHASTALGDAATYSRDPIELEAFAAGVDIAAEVENAQPIIYRFHDGRVIAPVMDGRYRHFQAHDLESDTDVHITSTWSLYGAGLRLRAKVREWLGGGKPSE